MKAVTGRGVAANAQPQGQWPNRRIAESPNR
jgi:hypothetical protein